MDRVELGIRIRALVRELQLPTAYTAKTPNSGKIHNLSVVYALLAIALDRRVDYYEAFITCDPAMLYAVMQVMHNPKYAPKEELKYFSASHLIDGDL